MDSEGWELLRDGVVVPRRRVDDDASADSTHLLLVRRFASSDGDLTLRHRVEEVAPLKVEAKFDAHRAGTYMLR